MVSSIWLAESSPLVEVETVVVAGRGGEGLTEDGTTYRMVSRPSFPYDRNRHKWSSPWEAVWAIKRSSGVDSASSTAISSPSSSTPSNGTHARARNIG